MLKHLNDKLCQKPSDTCLCDIHRSPTYSGLVCMQIFKIRPNFNCRLNYNIIYFKIFAILIWNNPVMLLQMGMEKEWLVSMLKFSVK